MINENAKLYRLATTPALLIFGARIFIYPARIFSFSRRLYRRSVHGKLLILLFFGYVTSIFVVAIAAEMRLLLPLAPFVLLLVQEFRTTPDYLSPQYEPS